MRKNPIIEINNLKALLNSYNYYEIKGAMLDIEGLTHRTTSARKIKTRLVRLGNYAVKHIYKLVCFLDKYAYINATKQEKTMLFKMVNITNALEQIEITCSYTILTEQLNIITLAIDSIIDTLETIHEQH